MRCKNVRCVRVHTIWNLITHGAAEKDDNSPTPEIYSWQPICCLMVLSLYDMSKKYLINQEVKHAYQITGI